VVVLEVPADGVRSGVQAGGTQLLAQLEDQVDGLGGDGVRVRSWSLGTGLEDSLAPGAVTGE
jgi:hypothetical protein